MARNFKISQLNADIDCNTVLLGRLEVIEKDVRDKGAAYFSQVVEKMKANPTDQRPPQSGENDPTYDEMLLILFGRVSEKIKSGNVGQGDGDGVLGEKVADLLKEHVEGLKADIANKKKEIAEEELEKSKKITSEDMRDGWDSKVSHSS